MAEANVVGDDEAVLTEGEHVEPLMPHKRFDKNLLRKLYPPLEVPDGLYGDDPEEELDRDDALLQEGMKVADQIVEHAENHGRRRRVPSPYSSPAL